MGDKAVAIAIAYYTLEGYQVSVPLSDTTKYDIVVDNGVKLNRVQVKSSKSYSDHDSPIVTLSTQGGNQSWGGVISYISSDNVEEVFVYHIEEKRSWRIPVSLCENKRKLTLTSKLDQYIVEL